VGRVLKRPLAEQDLYDIWDYIAVSASPERLAETPLIGRLRPELAAGLRSFPIDQ